MYHHTWLIFVFLVETGFHHVAQADLSNMTKPHLKLLGPSNLHASASQRVEITGVSHLAQLFLFYSF